MSLRAPGFLLMVSLVLSRPTGVLLVASVGLWGSCVSPTAQGPLIPAGWEETIRSEWTLAQNVLECLGYPAARDVRPEAFRWKVHSKQFPCAGYDATSGCFSAGARMIEFYSGHTWVIRHEAGHAILYALNQRPVWQCFGHGEVADDFCKWFPEIAYWERYCSLEGVRYEQ